MAIVTLLTDFGNADFYVAEMKGVLLSLAPSVVAVDVTHNIAQGDVRSGAYILGRVWHRFPPGTIHMAVVDPGVGTTRAALAFGARGHWFVGPDNGVFTPVLHDAEVEAVALPTPEAASPTFHGRDLFAPAAAALAAGTPLHALGQPFLGMPERLAYTAPHYEGKTVVGEIVYIDRFGSLVTNLTSELVPDLRHTRSRGPRSRPAQAHLQRRNGRGSPGLRGLRRRHRDRGAQWVSRATAGCRRGGWAGRVSSCTDSFFCSSCSSCLRG